MNAMLFLLAVSIIPGLLWLIYFYRKDRYEPEPKRLVLKVFFAGMIMVIPAGLFERLGRTPLNEARISGDLVMLFLLSFFLIGLIEEGVKFLVLTTAVYPNPELDEPVDGIVYGITVGLGFSAIENLIYTWSLGVTVGLVRAIVGCLAHASFTGWGGWYISRAKLSNRPWTLIPVGLGVSIFWHGLYDFLLFTGKPSMSFLAFLMVGMLIFRLVDKMRHLVDVSPFRK